MVNYAIWQLIVRLAMEDYLAANRTINKANNQATDMTANRMMWEENVGGEPLHCLRRATPQHILGADHFEEDSVPTQAIRFVQCTCA